MQNDSDTESESSPEPNPVGIFDYTNGPGGREFESISNAIQKIRDIEIRLLDVETIVKDTKIQQIISVASTTITTFLDCVHQTPVEYPHQNLVDFSELLSVSFLTVLFKHRKVFHKIAAHSLASEPGSSGAIVCWVDVILAKLGDASITVTTGAFLDLATPLFPGSTESRSEDSLRAASQLPSDWPSVVGVIASHKASPAAKRLALRLAFCAFVLGPRLCRKSLSSEIPHDMTEILDRCVNQTRATGFSASLAGGQLAMQERLNSSMTISLFAATDREHQNSTKVSQMRPHTLGCLLDMLQNVIHPDDSILSLQLVIPPDELDPAQTAILRFGDTVSWCWETWNDHRVANTESIVFLTSMWLLHSDKCFLSGDIIPEPDYMPASTASSLAILRLLHHIVFSLSTTFESVGPPSAPTAVICGACYNAVESLKHLLSGQKEAERWIISGFCRHLLSLFVLLTAETDEELGATDYILEALSQVDRGTLNVCLMHIIAESTIRFSTRLDALIIRVHKTLIDNGNLNVVRSALNFIALVWFSQARGCLLHQSASRLLSAAVDFLSQSSSPTLASKILGDAVLTASSAARADASFPEENPEAIWRFAMSSTPSELEIASSFAHYIIASDSLCNSLYCAEAWRYLGEVLLLILKHHYVEEQEPLALLTCPTVCRALTRLLQADSAATQFMLSTPFTLNLSADLKHACELEGSRRENYFVVMKERLNMVGSRLLDQIMCKSRSAAPETTPVR
ncbi:hypothetical protein B0H17DRAFT_1037040 [Mycena rosella]|uniref:Uncharacterized protein n=1 Tax=Mycena rosella TaxID=1033263 RepID=A0AAD7M9B7_MYCRO|nr:hypothetical protein B0H17DRAFT_1037040 [Mycena rosella]